MLNKQNDIPLSDTGKLNTLLIASLSESKSLKTSKQEELMHLALVYGWDSDTAASYVHAILNLAQAVRCVINKMVEMDP